MEIYQTEEEQVEALKKWWKENGNSVIFGVVLGLAAIFGWREWQDYNIEQSASASMLYQQMVTASRENNAKTVREKAKEITTAYENTAYAVFARLALAKIAVTNGELDAAAGDLQWALDNTSQDSLRHVISLRLARVLIAQGKLNKASAVLGTNSDKGEFSVSYQELEADMLRLENKVDAARDAYQQALSMAQASGQETTIIEMKLDDLGRNKTE